MEPLEVKLPEGCVCPPDSWFIPRPPPPCDAFNKGKDGMCDDCDHDKGCHKP